MQCFEQKFYGNKLYNDIKIDLNLLGVLRNLIFENYHWVQIV